jgi:hypothetical protein
MTDSVIEQIRSQLTDAPVNIEAIIRGLGVVVRKNADLPEGISGQLRKIDGKYEISSAKGEHYFRQRFSLAHELGHYVLHRDLIGEGVDDDTKYRSTAIGDFYNTRIDQYHEKQANSFAASLLVPERLIRDEVTHRVTESGGQPVPIRDLYTKFQVSPSAMRWRLRNLGLLEQVVDE